ncbi:MAG: NYN domain-containing protein [bacterium]|nr:NYN domain-containing protein [bacterium]
MSRNFPYPSGLGSQPRIMLFVDGENLAIRYESLLKGAEPLQHVAFKKGIYAWSSSLNNIGNPQVHILRRHYYTSVQGSEADRNRVHDELKEHGMQAPQVFQKHKTKGSKRVDISLSVDMLSHAHRKNYDIAVLVAGDEDYVPLLEAVMAEGCRVFLWFFEKDGLSPVLRRRADHFFDLEPTFFADDRGKTFRQGHYH